VGVVVDIAPMEYAAHLSAMTTKTHAPGYLMGSGVVNPTTSLRKSFKTGQTWNPSMWSDPEFDRRITDAESTRDEIERQRKIKELTVEMLDQAPYIWLPTPYNHIAWWPWVKNYGGELRAGAVRPAPIYARIWIDQKLKTELGF
jgi:peptide/nickel transport system substrate-binding protein